MNIFKTAALVALCFFNAGMFGQDQQPDLKQLDYDIMTWKARAKVIGDVKSLALKGTISFSLAAAAIVCSLFLCDRGNFRLSDLGYRLLRSISSCAEYGVKFFGSALFLNLFASKYAHGIVAELESNRIECFKTQKAA